MPSATTASQLLRQEEEEASVFIDRLFLVPNKKRWELEPRISGDDGVPMEVRGGVAVPFGHCSPTRVSSFVVASIRYVDRGCCCCLEDLALVLFVCCEAEPNE